MPGGLPNTGRGKKAEVSLGAVSGTEAAMGVPTED